MYEIVTWAILKSLVDSKGLYIQWYELDNTYYIYAADGSLRFQARIYKDSGADQTEFEATYKTATSANRPLTQLDTDGAQIVRHKAAKSGWTFSAMSMEFATSALQADCLHCKKADGTDISGVSIKIYNNSDTEITTKGVLDANLATAVKTVLDFEPPYDYELIGGSLRTETTISNDVRLWIVAVPDIAAASGGSKEMASGINLRYLTPGNVYDVDGRVSKYLTYSATYHTNKLRFIFKYPAGTSEALSIVLEHYKL